MRHQYGDFDYLPLVNKGKKGRAGRKAGAGCVLVLGRRQPAFVLRPSQPQFFSPVRSLGVSRGTGGFPARLTTLPSFPEGKEENAAGGALGPGKPL